MAIKAVMPLHLLQAQGGRAVPVQLVHCKANVQTLGQHQLGERRVRGGPLVADAQQVRVQAAQLPHPPQQGMPVPAQLQAFHIHTQPVHLPVRLGQPATRLQAALHA